MENPTSQERIHKWLDKKTFMHENKAMKLLASPQWQHTLTHDKPMAATLGLGRLTLSKPSPTPPCLPLKPSKNKKTCFSRQFSHICCSVLDANNEGSSPKPNTQASLTSTAVSPPPSVSLSMPGVEEGWEVARLSEEADPASIREWELDFCSRPIFDIRGKKLWELVVCDSQRNLEFSKFFPNNVINSITLKDSLVSICDSLGVPKPTIVRFFRSQMQTIVSKACNELGIRPVPSKRCFALTNWLEERYESVYKRHPGFKEGINPLPAIDKPFPLPLPDSLQGEKWAFVQLPLEVFEYSTIQQSTPAIRSSEPRFKNQDSKDAVREEIMNIKKQSMYGNFLDLDMLKTELPEDTMIPGVAVASSRATGLAAWTDSLEIASIDVDRERGCLTLTAGVSKRWLYAYYRKSAQTDKEAEAWEECKKECGGLHFLAVQDSLESESCTGFWLILDFPNPPI